MLTINEIISNSVKDNIIKSNNYTYGDLLNSSRDNRNNLYDGYFTSDEKAMYDKIKLSDINRLRKFS